jgi:hypothetical protein
MILGLSISAFTLLHVLLSLAGIATGLVAIVGLIYNRLFRAFTAVFLATTILTSATGFLFPFKGFTPGIILGILSIVALMIATVALYGQKLSGAWRGAYVLSASTALYFNVFVLFAQLFAKVPALKAVAPSQTSPAFGLTQVVVLVIFIFLTTRAFKGFRETK